MVDRLRAKAHNPSRCPICSIDLRLWSKGIAKADAYLSRFESRLPSSKQSRRSEGLAQPSSVPSGDLAKPRTGTRGFGGDLFDLTPWQRPSRRHREPAVPALEIPGNKLHAVPADRSFAEDRPSLAARLLSGRSVWSSPTRRPDTEACINHNLAWARPEGYRKAGA